MAYSNDIVAQMLSKASTWTGIQTFEEGTLVLRSSEDTDAILLAIDALTADKTVTFPDEDVDLGDIADNQGNIADNLASNLIGVENRAYVPVKFIGNQGGGNIETVNGAIILNVGSTNGEYQFMLDLPTVLGDLTLYIDAIRYYLNDADAGNKITSTVVSERSILDASSNSIENDVNVRDSAGAVLIPFTAVACTVGHMVYVELPYIVGTTAFLDLLIPQLRCYYA